MKYERGLKLQAKNAGKSFYTNAIIYEVRGNTIEVWTDFGNTLTLSEEEVSYKYDIIEDPILDWRDWHKDYLLKIYLEDCLLSWIEDRKKLVDKQTKTYYNDLKQTEER